LSAAFPYLRPGCCIHARFLRMRAKTRNSRASTAPAGRDENSPGRSAPRDVLGTRPHQSPPSRKAGRNHHPTSLAVPRSCALFAHERETCLDVSQPQRGDAKIAQAGAHRATSWECVPTRSRRPVGPARHERISTAHTPMAIAYKKPCSLLPAPHCLLPTAYSLSPCPLATDHWSLCIVIPTTALPSTFCFTQTVVLRLPGHAACFEDHKTLHARSLKFALPHRRHSLAPIFLGKFRRNKNAGKPQETALRATLKFTRSPSQSST
jgi:hypothetical protein